MLNKLRVPEWCCAVRFNTDGHTVFDDLETPFTVLKTVAVIGAQIRFCISGTGSIICFLRRMTG